LKRMNDFMSVEVTYNRFMPPNTTLSPRHHPRPKPYLDVHPKAISNGDQFFPLNLFRLWPPSQAPHWLHSRYRILFF
jgi:hypothetical protein